jgi:hypothetical protein
MTWARYYASMKSAWWAIVCVVISSGCDNRLKLLGAPDALRWRQFDRESFDVGDKKEMSGRFHLYKRELQLQVWRFPPNLAIELGDEKGTTDEEGSASLSINVTAMMAQLPIDRLDSAQLDGFTMVVRPKSGPPITHKLPPIRLGSSVETVLEDIAKQPVLFGKEPPRPAGPPRSLIDSDDSLRVYGTAATLGDIDAIAHYEVGRQVGTKQCDGYHSRDDGSKQPPVTLRIKEIDVNIRDRRTGAILDKRTFPPNEDCAILVSKGQSEVDSYAIPTAEVRQQVRDWLKSTVAATP